MTHQPGYDNIANSCNADLCTYRAAHPEGLACTGSCVEGLGRLSERECHIAFGSAPVYRRRKPVAHQCKCSPMQMLPPEDWGRVAIKLVEETVIQPLDGS